MKVLVLGSGAKDQAILWWLSKSNYVSSLFIAPKSVNYNYFSSVLSDVDPSKKDDVTRAVRKNNIDLVFIGTEAPLTSGVVKALEDEKIKVIGAPEKSLKLEDDKGFARAFSKRHSVSVPAYKVCSSKDELREFLGNNQGKTYVIKSNKLTPSRIMISTDETNALLEYGEFLLEKGPVIVEEKVIGLPLTVTIFMDNEGYLMLPVSSEYTSLSKSDKTQTGGLGAVCPVPLSDEFLTKIKSQIVEPTLNGLKEEGLQYRGILTFSLVISKTKEPVLVDYHVRLNDPATQAIIPLIETDALEVFDAILSDSIKQIKLSVSNKSSVAVVLYTPGYPNKIETGLELSNINKDLFLVLEGKPVVFSGAIKEENGGIVTTGGRSLSIVGIGNTIIEASENAYRLIKKHTFKELAYREDIGENFFKISSTVV